jgi:hypothetical protein
MGELGSDAANGAETSPRPDTDAEMASWAHTTTWTHSEAVNKAKTALDRIFAKRDADDRFVPSKRAYVDGKSRWDRLPARSPRQSGERILRAIRAAFVREIGALAGA